MTDTRRGIYTAVAFVTGGRAEGRARTSDGALDVDLRQPAEMGGSGGGTNPEQLFAIGFAACFESALGAVARRRGQQLGEVAIDSRVTLFPTKDRGYKLAVGLAVSLPEVYDPDVAAELVRAAHQVCPYSNAVRGNVEVWTTANGRPVLAGPEPAPGQAAA
jgi:osmotically inducible protein OsmC